MLIANASEITVTVKDSQLLINLTDAARSFKSFVASDARGNTLMDGFSNQVTSILELPAAGWEGYTVIVAPDGSADLSSYYLKFNAENVTANGTYGRGSWEEVGGWGTAGQLEDATMPHSFVYYKNDSGLTRFTFQPFSGSNYTDGSTKVSIPGWTNRLAGDEEEWKAQVLLIIRLQI